MIALAGPSIASAVPLTFTKLADTSTNALRPDMQYASFGDPSISGGQEAFNARSTGGDPFRPTTLDGIYAYGGGSLRRVVDQADQPSSNPFSRFSSFGKPSISGSDIAFTANFRDGGASYRDGVFVQNSAGLHVVTDTNADTTRRGMAFTSFGDPSISGGQLAFKAHSSDGDPFRPASLDGIYAYSGGSLRRVVGQLDQPSSNPFSLFSRFGKPSISSGNIAFTANFRDGGSPYHDGVFVQNGAGLRMVADTNADTTRRGMAFTSFGDPSISGDEVAFNAHSSDGDPFRPITLDGIYLYDGVALDRVVDEMDQPTSDPFSRFFSFGDPSISGSSVAFLADYRSGSASLRKGLFLRLNGVLDEIISAGDQLDGLTVASLGFGQDGIDGNALAFVAAFTDGSSGVFRVDVGSGSVPEPSTPVMVLTGLCLLRWLGRRGLQLRASYIIRKRRGGCRPAHPNC
ncbi:hypothetical protein ABWL39_18660 [Chitinivorax sp. PXF-14]|uniref:DUF7453 family protein n=1 Tax=Chitinivorax sp. PXF-14 TaxID=3230488 RepID=UPI0034662B83